MKKLNNKGYMIVEIIVSATIAMTIAYFMMDLIVKLKEKYDYVQNDTILMTDKTVITNEILGDLYKREICSAEEDGNSIKFIMKDNSFMTLSYEKETVEDSNTGKDKTEHWIRYYKNENNPNNIFYQKKLNENLQVKALEEKDISVENNIASFIISAETLTSKKNYGINIIIPFNKTC